MRVMKSKKKIIIVLVILFLILLMMLIWIYNPLIQSDESVRKYILYCIPMGTDVREVEKVVHNKGWTISEYKEDRGIRIVKDAYSYCFASKEEMINGTDNPRAKIVGSKSMLVEIGEYRLFYYTYVRAFLVFDENDKLVEVVVWHEVDSP